MNATCPHCQQKYEVDESYYGHSIQCVSCKNDFVLTRPEITLPSPEITMTGASPSEKQCPFCCSTLSHAAAKCPHCGEWVIPHSPVLKIITMIAFILLVVQGAFLISSFATARIHEALYPYNGEKLSMERNIALAKDYYSDPAFVLSDHSTGASIVFLAVFAAAFLFLNARLKKQNLVFMQKKTVMIFVLCMGILTILMPVMHFVGIKSNASTYLANQARAEGEEARQRLAETEKKSEEDKRKLERLKELDNISKRREWTSAEAREARTLADYLNKEYDTNIQIKD